MKTLYSVFCIFLIASLNLISQKGDDGRIYYFSPIPSRQDSAYTNEIKLYITSSEADLITVEVPGKDFKITKKAVRNDFIEFSIPASIGEVYLKNDEDKPIGDTVFINAAIKVITPWSSACYCINGGERSSSGFTALHSGYLGKNYIISSHPDYSNNETEYFPGEVTITGAYDKTRVKIIKNKSDSPDTTNYILHTADVLLLSTHSKGDDLTGTVIEATKPVAVVSGNYCAYIPETATDCDMISEFEIPTITWGKEYYVPFLWDREKNPIIKIFPKEDSTNIYRDGEFIGSILMSGGKEGIGFLQMRSDTGTPRPVVISGDKPINVVMYNPSSSEDNIQSNSAQLSLLPTEQFTGEVSFKIDGSQFSPWDCLIIVYESETGELPDEMQFAQVINGDYEWMKLKELSPKQGTPFVKMNDKNYFLKNVLLPGNGVFKVRNLKPFAAYIYSNETYCTHLFPAAYTFSDQTKIDTLPPVPEWVMDSLGNVNGTLKDTAEYYERSNISTIYLHTDLSYNYILKQSDFMPCEDSIATWQLEIVDPTDDARAVITFADCAGNDTTLDIMYKSTDVSEEINSDGITFNPNPASDKLIISSEKPISDIKIFDILGCERFCSYELGDGRAVVNTADLNDGIYFVRLLIGKRMTTKKFIIRR